ncbi:MAG: T9SS type A sorting domain-containing protein, partial [Anaerolineales bacterium]|nr:T9SS type A sorting domain-containing protein [Anaerolineales bacterium]
GQATDFDACMEDESDCPVGVSQPGAGDPNQCFCSAADAESNSSGCNDACGALGDINGDSAFNVLDIVTLANCVLATNCGDLTNACAADMNADGAYNVLDIVTLANCVLATNCGGRIDDASESKLTILDNMLSIEADGFIGGVQMTLTHGVDFSIEMTDRALFADYLTEGNETRLLVITPETDDLFSFSGDFEIAEIIVANSQDEISASLPLAASFSLSDAYPNPFNPTTTMTLTMPVAGVMKVGVYNLLGQSVATLATGYKEIGTYNLTWDAADAASGMYFVKAEADGFTKIQKLMLVK